MLSPYYYIDKIEAGCDEAGRGCLAGSVYAAAVILPKDYRNDLLNDSKQLTAHQRYMLRETIEHDAIAWAVGVVTAQEIDKMNILRASITAMHRAIAKTYRDDYMRELHKEYPYYGWDHNAGYPTKEHRRGIAEHGLSPYHRLTFNQLGDGQLSLDF